MSFYWCIFTLIRNIAFELVLLLHLEKKIQKNKFLITMKSIHNN